MTATASSSTLPNIHTGSNNNNNTAATQQQPPSPRGGSYVSTATTPGRFGMGNPLSNCGATIIGLGTVGLGDRSTEERKRASRHQYEQWKYNKEAQQIAERNASGGNTPKKPLTSKEQYLRTVSEAREVQERRMDREMEVSRKCREDAARQKQELNASRTEERDVAARFQQAAREESERIVSQRPLRCNRDTNSPTHESREERTRRVQAQADARRATFQECTELFNREHSDYIRSLHDSFRDTLNTSAAAYDESIQQRRAITQGIAKTCSKRKDWLKKTDVERTNQLKEMAKDQRSDISQRIDSAREKLMTRIEKDAETVRNHRVAQPKDDAKAYEERQRQHMEDRKRAQQERAEILNRVVAERAVAAQEIRKSRTELAKLLAEDRNENSARRQRLHDDTVQSRSPTVGGNSLSGTLGSPSRIPTAPTTGGRTGATVTVVVADAPVEM